MHSTDNLEDGYFGGGKRIKYSVRKHGKEAHVKEILEFLETRELLKNREKEIINEELLLDPLCMNLTIGGEGGFTNKEQMLKCCTAGAISTNKKIWEGPNNEKYRKETSDRTKKLHEENKIKYKPFKGQHTEKTKIIIGEKNSINV